MNNTALATLQPYLRTKQDVNDLIEILSKLIEELYTESFNLNNFLIQHISYELASSIEKISPNPNDKRALQDFYLKLQKDIENLPLIHIILPFAPKVSLITIIHDWFYQSYHRVVILDITVDPTLIGGSVISYKGRANDYSLKN